MRTMGEQFAPEAVNFVVLMTAGLERWEQHGHIRGADPGTVARLFEGLTWRRRLGNHPASRGQEAFLLGPCLGCWPGFHAPVCVAALVALAAGACTRAPALRS